MSMFSKPPIKKPGPAAADLRKRPAPPPSAPGKGPSAREVADHAAGRAQYGGDGRQVDPGGDITMTGASLVEWSAPGQPSLEGGQANPGSCAVLEDAVL